VIHRERLALPAAATVEVRLEDVSIVDAAAVVLAEQTIATNGRQVPIAFELSYDPARIEPNRRYGLRASIRGPNGDLMFATTTHYGVLTQGAPANNVEVLVQRVGDSGSTGSITGGPWRLVAIQRAGAVEEAVGAEPVYTIEFGADGRYTGQAHCNRYLGGYERSGPDRVTMRGGAATLAACPEPSIANEFLRAVAAATHYNVRGDELVLSADAGTALRFRRGSAVGEVSAAPEGSDAPWTDAKRRGATFRALGQEPSWVLEIHPERLALLTNLGASRTELAYAAPTVDGNRTTYRASGDGREIVAIIERADCIDSMSGQPFEARAVVTFDGSTLRGCGRFL
jgi:putative lipoprotein